MSSSVQLTALKNIPLIQPNDNLIQIIADCLIANNITLQHGDIIVIAQKIVSKAEGREVVLNDVKPSENALELAEYLNKDPRLVELVLSESSEVMRKTKGNKKTDEEGILIVRHRLGYVLANAGIDMSNVMHLEQEEHALLLPQNPDASCAQICQGLLSLTGSAVGVIINDSHGRAWRSGTVGTAIGIAGLPGILDLRGAPDLFGRKLKTTIIGFADEIAAAASMLMGQASEGTPVVHIRGLEFISRASTIQELIREKERDLFL